MISCMCGYNITWTLYYFFVGGGDEVRRVDWFKMPSIHAFMNSFFIIVSIHVFMWISFISLVIMHLFLHEILICSIYLHSVLTYSSTTHSFIQAFIHSIIKFNHSCRIHTFNNNLLISAMSVLEEEINGTFKLGLFSDLWAECRKTPRVSAAQCSQRQLSTVNQLLAWKSEGRDKQICHWGISPWMGVGVVWA